jgi:hypothetical protein
MTARSFYIVFLFLLNLIAAVGRLILWLLKSPQFEWDWRVILFVFNFLSAVCVALLLIRLKNKCCKDNLDES